MEILQGPVPGSAGVKKGKSPGKRKADPSEVARLADAERAEHERRIAALHAELREQLGVVDLAETRLREAQGALDKHRADSEDINKYLERQLSEKRQLGEEMAAVFQREQQEALRSRAELRRLIDAEEAAGESRRSQNQAQMAQNRQALAFVEEYERLNVRNASAGAYLAARAAELAAISDELALKRRWSAVLGAARLGGDEAGLNTLPTLVVEMMRAFPQQSLVQEQALAMLSALLAENDEAHNARCIHRAGGVPLTLRALIDHGRARAGGAEAGGGGEGAPARAPPPSAEASLNVATHACSLLWMLAVSSAEVCDEVAQHEALALLVATLHEHIGSSRLAYNACGAICHLLVTRPHSLTVAAQIGAAPSIEQADLPSHPACTRKARPPPPNMLELRRQVNLLRVGHAGQPAALPPVTPPPLIVVPPGALSGSIISAFSFSLSPGQAAGAMPRRKRASRKAAAAWHRDLLIAAVAKLTRSERAELPVVPSDLGQHAPPELAAREHTAQAALGALLAALRSHPTDLSVCEYALCALWNLLLSSATLSYEFVHNEREDALGLLAGALRAHASAPGVVLYAVAVLLAVVDVEGATERMAQLDVARLAQQAARSHTLNARLQEGVVALLDALERAELAALAEAGGAPAGWTAAAYSHWLRAAARLRAAFSDLSPDSTAIYRMLATLRANYHRLGQLFRHYALTGSGWRDAPLGGAKLGLREWHELAKMCRLSTRSFSRAEIERVFLQTALEPKDSLSEHLLSFGEFLHALILVAFERLNPFAADWLVGRSTDVPMVPIDEAVSHLLHQHLFALADMPNPEVVRYLVKHELVGRRPFAPFAPRPSVAGPPARSATHSISPRAGAGGMARHFDRLLALTAARLAHPASSACCARRWSRWLSSTRACCCASSAGTPAATRRQRARSCWQMSSTLCAPRASSRRVSSPPRRRAAPLQTRCPTVESSRSTCLTSTRKRASTASSTAATSSASADAQSASWRWARTPTPRPQPPMRPRCSLPSWSTT